jgi:hypothetical protein
MNPFGSCENLTDWANLFGDNGELSEEMLSLYNNLRIAKSIAEEEKKK